MRSIVKGTSGWLMTGLLILLSSTWTSAAADAGIDPGGGPAISSATVLLSLIPGTYYMVYGHYPESWKAVRDSGLVQVDLKTSDGSVVDPDDRRFDFAGDCVYQYLGPQRAPVFQLLTSREGMQVKRMPCSSANGTYNDVFDILQKKGLEIPEYWRTNQAQLAFGMNSLISSTIDTWYTLYGKNAKLETFEAVLNCGICPFDSSSVNPSTGKLLTNEGIPFGFMFIAGQGVVHRGGGESWPVPPQVYPTGPDGQPIKGISY